MSLHQKYKGFTLIEVVIFIVGTAILASAILSASNIGLLKAPGLANQITANMLAQQCMEWLVGNRVLNGYNALSCPSTPSATLCNSPSGYTISPSVACTTLNSDSNFKTITVTVTGNGSATLKTLIANY